jgi:hypothetical protein
MEHWRLKVQLSKKKLLDAAGLWKRWLSVWWTLLLTTMKGWSRNGQFLLGGEGLGFC